MSNILRFFRLFIVLACIPLSVSAADNNDFTGSWTAWLCPAGVQPDTGKCSSFVLALFQKQDKVCGSHVFATAGARAMDEGAAPSLVGTVTDGTASVTVESGRGAGVRVQAELKAAKGMLQWRRLSSPVGDYLLPASANLTRSKRGSLFSPVFEQKLSAACTANLDLATQPGPAPITPQPEQRPQPSRPAS